MRDIRAETIYFVFLDRFADGDTSNNEGKAPACTDTTRADYLRYWGGDIEGLIGKLDYLQRLGITCIRISPVLEQIQTLSMERGRLSAPYHGYWARDWRRIDPHLLPPDEWDEPFSARDTIFDRLLEQCHRRGMRVVMDFVCKYSNPGGLDAPRGELYDDGTWLLSHEHDNLGWYRHDMVRDDSDRRSEASASFDEASVSYRRHLYSVLGDWAERGLDGFCFDSVRSLPIWFWQELTSTLRARRADLSLYGTSFSRSTPEEVSADFANQCGLRMVDTGFQRRVVEAMCWNDVGGFGRIAQYLERDDLYHDATSLVTMLDTHTTARLLSAGLPNDHLLLAVTLLMTSRGTPCLFYGTEQYLHDDTDGGNEPYNRPMMTSFELDTPVARALPRLALLRQDNLAVQRGRHQTLWVGENAIVYARSHAHDHVLVALNRGPAMTVDLTKVPLPDGPIIDLLGGSGAMVQDGAIGGFSLPANTAQVFAHTEPRELVGSSVLLRLSGYATRFGESIVVTGDAPELGQWDMSKAPRLQYVNRNLWLGDVLFDVSVGKPVLYKYAVIDTRGNVQRETILPRSRVVPPSSGFEWADNWM